MLFFCQDDIVLAISPRPLFSFRGPGLLSSLSLCFLLCLTGLEGPSQFAPQPTPIWEEEEGNLASVVLRCSALWESECGRGGLSPWAFSSSLLCDSSSCHLFLFVCLCLLCASLPLWAGWDLEFFAGVLYSDVWDRLEGDGPRGVMVFLGGRGGPLRWELGTW